MEESKFSLDEAGARRLVLVRAIEEADTQGKLLSEVEREQLELQALQATRAGSPGGQPDLRQYLQHRAAKVLEAVRNRNPQLAALQEPEPWRRWLLWALPLGACVLGAALDRIDNPQQVNMLSPPLLGVLFWNLVAYAVLLLGALRPAAAQVPRVVGVLQRWLARAPAPGRRTGRLRADVLSGFHQHWLRATGGQQLWWGKTLLHLTAAGWALGLALSIMLGGLVRQYRVGWESTLLELEHVHAFLRVLFAPVVALLPFDGFSAADLQRMAFGSGAAVGVDEARRWVWMYLALLAIVVVLPRLALAAWAAWRRERLGRAVAIDLREPYFVELLARVSPARVTLALRVDDGAGREMVLRMLRQAGERPPSTEGLPWTVLTTAKGDQLRVFEIPAGYPVPAVPAPASAAPSAAQAWLQDLMGRFKSAPAARGDPLQVALAETDVVLLVATQPAALQEAAPLLHWVAQPALVLAPAAADRAGLQEAAQRLGLAAQVLPLEQAAGHWLRDTALLDAIAAQLAPSKRVGFARMASAWRETGEQRFGEAMRLLAELLVRAARDSEDLGTAPAGLRQLVRAGERESAGRARVAAAAQLLERLRAAETGALAELVRLHRVAAPAAPLAAARLDDALVLQQPVDRPQAGMAGAATGAAMGAGIDLLTGGLTLGAAAALGAAIGGGAGYVAAALRNRSAPSGRTQVQLGDEVLQTLAENALLAYLAVAHRGAHPQQGLPPAWRSEVVAAVASRRDALAALWAQARSAVPGDGEAVAPLARELGSLMRGLLARL